jgi:RNA polymerase sigma-70 factor (ECF subfamily)
VLAGEAAEGSWEDSEARLVDEARRRSPEAWAHIYAASYVKLYRYCYARTGDSSTAADLASRVFLEALEGIDRFSYRGRPLLAWLYRIARNVVADHLKRRRREAQAVEREADRREPHDPGPSTRIADELTLRSAMEQLTEDQRQVVALRFFAQFTTPEIAEALGRSERAVYSLEVRALAALRRLLEPEGDR